jgi:hypothetical protein
MRGSSKYAAAILFPVLSDRKDALPTRNNGHARYFGHMRINFTEWKDRAESILEPPSCDLDWHQMHDSPPNGRMMTGRRRIWDRAIRDYGKRFDRMLMREYPHVGAPDSNSLTSAPSASLSDLRELLTETGCLSLTSAQHIV